MVLALLAMGLGCSEEPREPPPTTTVAPTTTTMAPTPTTMAPTPTTMLSGPGRSEQWTHLYRQGFVDGCVKGIDVSWAMAERDVAPRDVCRCGLYELERQFSESDYRLLSEEERADAIGQAATVCRDTLLGD
jgi:hypothetical protein